MRRAILALAVAGLVWHGAFERASAGPIAFHAGVTDPTAEGFSIFTAGSGGSTEGPVNSESAWQITSPDQGFQFAYVSAPFDSSQQAAIAAGGFELTMRARVSRNGHAPAYDSGNFTEIGGSFVQYSGTRWEMDLGVDSNGHTVVILPDSIDSNGPGMSIEAPGAHITLTDSNYHTYQLIYNPSANTANLFVDGTLRLSNYQGNPTNTSFNSELVFHNSSGGQSIFQLVEADIATPEPATLTLLGLGCAGLAAYRWRRRKAAVA